MRIVRLSGAAQTHGVLTVRSCPATLWVYGLAKTVADCFKGRHKLGMDAAIEALREGWRARKFAHGQLHINQNLDFAAAFGLRATVERALGKRAAAEEDEKETDALDPHWRKVVGAPRIQAGG